MTLSKNNSIKCELIKNPGEIGSFQFEMLEWFVSIPPLLLYKLTKWRRVIEGSEPGAEIWKGYIDRIANGRVDRASTLAKPREIEVFRVGTQNLRFATSSKYANQFVQRNLKISGGHEPGVVDYLASRIKPGGLFVDIGAHSGYFSCFVASLGATSLAVELQPSLVNVIRVNAILNNLWSVHVVNAAIGETQGLTQVYRLDAGPGMQILDENTKRRVPDRLSVNHDLVPCMTLDDLLPAKGFQPLAVKIDVEGAEVRVLKGASKLIARRSCAFVIEVHPHLLKDFSNEVADVLDAFPPSGWKILRVDIDTAAPITHDEVLALANHEDRPDLNPALAFEPI